LRGLWWTRCAGASSGLVERHAGRGAPRAARELRPRPAGEPALDLAGNDYLGLSTDPRVIEGGLAALRTWGAGSTGSRLVTGSTALHAELERELAAFTGYRSALVFSSGYLANLGVVTALSGPGSLIVSDGANHASLIDAAGCPGRGSRWCSTTTWPRWTRCSRPPERRALLVTDSVGSVDGDHAPLAELHAVARAGARCCWSTRRTGSGCAAPAGAPASPRPGWPARTTWWPP